VLDQRGIADRFLARGQTAQVATFAGTRLDMSDFPSRHPYGLALLQDAFEEILTGWVAELGVPILRGRDVTGLAQDEAGVDVAVAGGAPLRAAYLVGCDGGRSLIRKAAGIDFPGWEPSVSSLIAEAEARDEIPAGIVRDGRGQHGLGTLEDGRIGVVVSGPYAGQTGAPTLAELREAVTAVWGTDFGIHSPTWISRFTDMTRQAAAYRKGRVLLAGDAAHVHYPIGGQGLNLGVQDAVNLGWKLAQVVAGASPERLLDTYHGERHPVAARVLRITMAQTAVTRRDDRIEALREAVAELLGMDEPRRRFAGLMSGLDIRYDLGDGHPLVGRRVPDLDLATADGPMTVFALLHGAGPALVNLAEPGAIDIAPWADRVRLLDARYEGRWALPVVGEVPAPAALLIRPDGHVAWVGDGTDTGLAGALTTWFGPPARG
jgi:2-polyprenyl-6-methoxyphenol hydroxylase-like FAD-dependent oxidoreductase